MTAKELALHTEMMQKKNSLKYIDGEKSVYVTDWPIEAQRVAVQNWNKPNGLIEMAKALGKKVSVLYEHTREVLQTEIPEPNIDMWLIRYCWETGRVLKSDFVEILPGDYKPSILLSN